MTRVLNQQNRRGIALVISLIAMVVIGALVTGIFSSAMLDQRTGEGTRRQNQAFAVADAAAGEIIAGWNTASYNGMANGASVAVSGTSPNATGTYTGTITRVNDQFFLVDVIGKDRYSGSRQRVGLLVKLRLLNFDIRSALTERGPGSVGGSVNISGVDARPWTDCPPSGPTLAGIRSPDAADIHFIGGCSDLSCISGSPQVQQDATVTDNTFFSYGNSDWNSLASMANMTLASGTYNGMAPSVSGGNCNTASTNNWGEPYEPGTVPACRGYMPIIYVTGDLHISGGRGQGILMVNGNLDLSGGFEFDGIVIARGQLRTTGTGNHVTGGVMSANVDLDDEAVLGNAVLQYSSCAVSRVASTASPGAQLKSRGWLQVY